MDVDHIAAWMVGGVAISLACVCTFAFSLRLYKAIHPVSIVALIGCTVNLVSSGSTILSRGIPIPALYCSFVGRLLGFGSGSAAAFLLVLHYTLKARLLNVIPGSWTTVQKICLAGAIITTWSGVAAIFVVTPVPAEEGMCEFVSPAWLPIVGTFTSFLVNFIPTFAFIGPLIKAWGSVSGHRSGSRSGTWSQIATLLQAIGGHMDSTRSHGEDSISMRCRSSPSTDVVVPTSSREKFTTGGTIAATPISSVQSESVTSGMKRRVAQLDEHKQAKRARIIRRVFLSSVSSFATSSIILALFLAQFIGPEFSNSLMQLDATLAWVFAVTALPLPAESQKSRRRRLVPPPLV